MLPRPRGGTPPVVDAGLTRRTLDPTLARRLDAVRRARGYTIHAIAARAGVSKTMVGYLMTGERVPSKGVAVRVTRALGLDDDHPLAEALWEAAVVRAWPDR